MFLRHSGYAVSMQSTHPLMLWLVVHGVNRKAFAQDAGIGQPYLSDLIAGIKRPSLEVADRISAATGGAITAEHFPGRRSRRRPARSQ